MAQRFSEDMKYLSWLVGWLQKYGFPFSRRIAVDSRGKAKQVSFNLFVLICGSGQDRTGYRSFPHHRTCGFPHPAVEPSDITLSQSLMEQENHRF